MLAIAEPLAPGPKAPRLPFVPPTQTADQITSSVTLEGIVTVVFNADKDGMQAAFAQSIIDSTGGLFEEIIDIEAAERQRRREKLLRDGLRLGFVGDRHLALTRPLSDAWFAMPPEDADAGGPSINLATSPDMLHWRPVADFAIRASRASEWKGIERLRRMPELVPATGR